MTMGELTPLPGIFVFHSGLAGSMSGSGPSATPLPLGPRKRGQSEPSANANVIAHASDVKRQKRLIGSVLAGVKRAGGLLIIAKGFADATVGTESVHQVGGGFAMPRNRKK